MIENFQDFMVSIMHFQIKFLLAKYPKKMSYSFLHELIMNAFPNALVFSNNKYVSILLNTLSL